MSKGLDIKIKNITKGDHFTMIQEHTKDGGKLDWYYLLKEKGNCQELVKTVWGATFIIHFYLDENNTLVAECKQ